MQVAEAGMAWIIDAVAEMDLTQEGSRHLQCVEDTEAAQAFMGAVPVQEGMVFPYEAQERAFFRLSPGVSYF